MTDANTNNACQGDNGNCGCTDGVSHTQKCFAEHEACIDGCVKQPAPDGATVESAVAPESLRKPLMDALPHLLSAIDHSISDIAGRRMGFVLMVFTDQSVVHASNMNPASVVEDAIIALGESLKAQSSASADTSAPNAG